MTLRLFLSFFTLFMGLTSLNAQTEQDSITLRKLYDISLMQGKSYEWLRTLTKDIGPRLSGSEGAEKAVQWAKKELETLQLDSVWLQPVMVPKWTRGAAETAYFTTTDSAKTTVPICALGGSVATAENGLSAKVIEVQGIEDLERYGKDQLKGKLVFYNRPMQADLIETFNAYGNAVDQRGAGAMEAAKYGAVGVIVRSMNLRQDDFPHTGAMSYGDLPDEQRIPAAAISTNGANLLSKTLKENPETQFYYKMSCENHEDVKSYNVIGQITGSESPEKYMVVGGHMDSWDLGEGAQDDGAGIVQSMEVLRLMKASNYKPKHSIRAVLYMNEENGLRGGTTYAEEAKKQNQKHIFALESDSGGFTPRGFSFDASDANVQQVLEWKELFKPYLIHYFEKGHSGADIGPLEGEGIVLAGLRPDSQRYFDYHHAANDTFEVVNRRELELGAAAMASLVYLFDRYGVK
ncbi:M20/M25/M40 family metallo-hydrolase [Flavimarina sp. Hel_I_48]|uniref:M20/M25/M40 family metallo-hydrolase n=1 Tax=Flavimarina sp. Hel_I_48 TaxID=1392488 RepID=UPI0004DF03B4|nr:M20/M25/M40 family metallo-hydrolase [Flavimarina sp. Hel_I_48]